MPLRKCAVLGCFTVEKQAILHTFPNVHNEVQRFKQWVVATGNKELLKVEPIKIQKAYKVCHNHFDNHDINNVHLQKYALPTLNLPGNYGCILKCHYLILWFVAEPIDIPSDWFCYT